MVARPRVSLVVCTLDEEGNVGAVLRRVPPVVDEILVVDGRSRDRTVEEALAADPRVRAVTQDGRGKGDALRKGFRLARGDVVVQMDADGSMDPAEIPRFVAAIEAGADVAKGSRNLPGGGSDDLTPVRAFGNWWMCALGNALHGARFTDLCYGFIAFRRRALESIEISSNGFDVEAEVALKLFRAGFRVVEVPSFEHDRMHGHSHLHAVRDGWTIVRTILALPLARPLR
ncbi:MAG TPA: glycosyltransferase family 2 protein [Candidatus Thermoplasmatota archaeon]|nr:glycosyltransferase family 2 protein [Candidatus Thermoplasmatota archaeon]